MFYVGDEGKSFIGQDRCMAILSPSNGKRIKAPAALTDRQREGTQAE